MADKVSTRSIGDLVAEVPAGGSRKAAAQEDTVRGLLSDEQFMNGPLDYKLDRFQKATKNDHDYQKLGDDVKTAVHGRLFPQKKEAAMPTVDEGPPEQGGAVVDPNDPTGGYVPSPTTIPPEAISQIKPAFPGSDVPKGPVEPTESTSFLGAVGKGAVKGAEALPGLVSGVGQLASAGAEKIGLRGPQSPEEQDVWNQIAHPIQSFVTGPLLSPDTPGYRIVEHVVENLVGTATVTPLIRKIFPALAAGKPLTKDLIEQSLQAAASGVAGQVVKDAGGGGVAQVATELSATAIPKLAVKIYKGLSARPGMVQTLTDAIKEQNPDLASNMAFAKEAEHNIPGYKATLAEQVGPESDIAAGVSSQLTKDQPIKFGIPYKNQIKANSQSVLDKIKSVFGTSNEAEIGGGVKSALKPVREATAHHEFLQGVHSDLEAEMRALENAGVQSQRTAENAHYDVITKSRDDVRAAQDAATTSKQAAEKLVQDSKQQGVELDTALLKKHRDAEAEALTAKQAAQDRHVAALQESQDAHQTVVEGARYGADPFKGSAVSDAKGNLEVVYHGTNASFDTFDKSKGSARGVWGPGQYFTTDPAAAANEAKIAARTGGAENIRPSHLNIQNPLYAVEPLSDASALNIRKAINEHMPNVGDPEVAQSLREFRSDVQHGKALDPVLLSEGAKKELPAILKKAGYDGVIQGDVRITFEPNQIRSTFESAAAKKLGTVTAKSEVAALQGSLERLQTDNAEKLGKALEEHRAAFATDAPRVAAGGESALRAGVKEAGASATDFFRKSRDLVFGTKKTATADATPGFFGKIYKDIYQNVDDAGVSHPVTGGQDFKQKFMDIIRKDGSFEEKLSLRLQDRYEPDPIMNEIRNHIVTKAEKAGFGEEAAVRHHLTNGGDGAAFWSEAGTSGMQTPLNLEDIAGYRSIVLQELRQLPAESPRRRVLNSLGDIMGVEMESMARDMGPDGEKVLARIREVAPIYRTEINRHFSGPGKLATAINPRTGDAFYPTDFIGKNLFGSSPLSSTSLADSRHVEMFGQYVRDLDHAVEEGFITGDHLAVAEARRAKNALFDHIKNSFYGAAVDPSTEKMTVKTAEKWISDHQDLVDQSPELKKLFASNKGRLQVIRDVEAATQGEEAAAKGLLNETKKASDVASTAGEEATYQSRKALAEAKRTGAAVQTQEERAAAATLTQKKQSFEDLGRAQAEAERQAALRKQEQGIAQGGNLTAAQRTAQDEKLASERSGVGTRRTTEDRMADAREKLRLSKERLDKAAEDKANTVKQWKQDYGLGGQFTDPLNDNIAQGKFGTSPKDFINRAEALPLKDKEEAYSYFFSKTPIADQPALKHSVAAAMWENFLDTFDVSKIDPATRPDMVAEFLKKNGRILDKHMPQYSKDLKEATRVLDNIAAITETGTAGVPGELKATPRGEMRVRDVAVTTGVHLAGFGYALAGPAGLLTEMFGRIGNRRLLTIQKEILLNPDSTRIAAQLASTAVRPNWKRTALRTLAFRSGVTAEELED